MRNSTTTSYIRTLVLLVGLVGVGVVYMLYLDQNKGVTRPMEMTTVNTGDEIPVNWMPYAGERRKTVVKRTPHPKPPFKTGVYDITPLNIEEDFLGGVSGRDQRRKRAGRRILLYRVIFQKFNTTKYTDNQGHIFIPTEQVLRNMSLDELQEMYFRYIENIQVRCPRSRHIGDDRDGGYHVCETVVPNGCLAYSFGNRKDYSFDDGLAFHYGCEIHSFDPGDRQIDHQHGELVSFHKLGLGGENKTNKKNWTLKTLDSIRQMLGHANRPLDVLKIDIEGGEWPALTQILKSNTLERAHVKLLITELHMHYTKKDFDAFMLALKTLQGIRDTEFRIYYFRIWAGMGFFTKYKRAFANEVHFVKIPAK